MKRWVCTYSHGCYVFCFSFGFIWYNKNIDINNEKEMFIKSEKHVLNLGIYSTIICFEKYILINLIFIL